MRATIKDIAADTGLSVTTVSLVLNGKAYKIPDDTKKRIMEAAKRLNYRPNQLAVSLVKKRSKTIGLIIPDIGNVFYAHMVKGIEECCRESGRTLILCNTNDRHERDMEYIHLLADQGVDGSHLAELGHKRIACVTGPARLADSGRRLKGYVRALEEFQIPFDETLIYEGDYTMECGTRAVDALMPHGFTAVFACNDLSAFGVCRQLSKYNLKVPEDVSVVGYDDVLYAEMMAVPLTTVRQPVYEMGVESVKRLISQIKGKKSENKITVFEPKLMIRSSTVGMGQECRI